MFRAELYNWPGVVDRREFPKVDAFRTGDFKAARNCDCDLYTGFDNKDELREKALKLFHAK